MTPDPIVLLLEGVAIGANLTLVAQFLDERRRDRRDQRQAQAKYEAAQLRADRRAAGLCLDCGADGGESHSAGCTQTLVGQP